MVPHQMHNGRPTEDEAVNFYRGFPSHPRLIAAAGVAQFIPSSGPREGPFKDLMPCGYKSLPVDPWEDEEISKAITQKLEPFKWNAIDTMRVGYSDLPEKHRPVTMLISVDPDSTTWDEAYPAVCAIKKILEDAGFPDINVEMKVGQVFFL